VALREATSTSPTGREGASLGEDSPDAGGGTTEDSSRLIDARSALAALSSGVSRFVSTAIYFQRYSAAIAGFPALRAARPAS
jgi:hypothetical protein